MAAFWASIRRSPLAGPSSNRRAAGRSRWLPGLIQRWRGLGPYGRGSASGSTLPGAGQRRRLGLAWLTAALTFLLRPFPPFQWLPGWCVGLLLLWAIAELIGWLWWPQRSA